jgi:cobaltochelatase CobN
VEDDRLCTVALLSTSDTDLLAARSSGSGYRLANPARILPDDLPALLEGSGHRTGRSSS